MSLRYDYTARQSRRPAAVSNDYRTAAQKVAEFFTGQTGASATAYERLPLHRRVKIKLMLKRLKRLERGLVARAKAQRPAVYCDPRLPPYAGRGKAIATVADLFAEVRRESKP